MSDQDPLCSDTLDMHNNDTICTATCLQMMQALLLVAMSVGESTLQQKIESYHRKRVIGSFLAAPAQRHEHDMVA